MGENIQRYIEIRSNGKKVIGRVVETASSGERTTTPFTGPTRKHMLRKVRSAYRVNTKITFNRRGITNF